MNYHRKFSMIISSFAVLLMLAVSFTASQAAVDYFLKIDGIKGEAQGYQKTIECANGSHIKLVGLKPGTYRVQLVSNQSGQAYTIEQKKWLPANFKLTIDGVEAMAIKGKGAPTANTTGQATVVRGLDKSHRLFRGTIDASSPVLFTIPIHHEGLYTGDISMDW